MCAQAITAARKAKLLSSDPHKKRQAQVVAEPATELEAKGHITSAGKGYAATAVKRMIAKAELMPRNVPVSERFSSRQEKPRYRLPRLAYCGAGAVPAGAAPAGASAGFSPVRRSWRRSWRPWRRS
jgi:hypothetical protein